MSGDSVVLSPADLTTLLPAYLDRQRWFGSRPLLARGLDIVVREVVTDPWPAVVRVEAVCGAPGRGGGSRRADVERYNIVLALRPVDDLSGIDIGEVAVVGAVDTAWGSAFCYDALVDPTAALALLRAVAPGEEATDARPMRVEQSNTSVVFDERLVFKVFRRLHGPNADVMVTTALASHGFPNVAAPIAVWRAGEDDLGIVQQFLAGGIEGWALAITSLRDVAALGGDPGQAGGDFAPEAARLGALTAAMHRALAEAFGADAGSPGAWAQTIGERLTGLDHPGVDRSAALAVVAHLAGIEDAGRAVRVHGDYHLGQVLHTDHGWFVVDFEGEPGEGAARWLWSSPLQDVAGMLRSFDYAAMTVANENARDSVIEVMRAWERRNRRAFLTAYEEGIAGSGLVPENADDRAVILTAFELDKAVYEVGYEQAHRPEWVNIPLEGVRRLVLEGA
jgi:maltokinase